MSTTPDMIIIRSLRAQVTVGPDRWSNVCQQPIVLSVFIEIPLVAAGRSDDVVDSIHYGDLARDLVNHIDDATFDSLYALAKYVAEQTLAMDDRIVGVEVAAEAENQFLHARCLGVQVRRARGGGISVPDRTLVQNLAVSTIIGVNPPERKEKQVVLVDLTFISFGWVNVDWKGIHATIVQVRFILILSW
jgi:FolB domain-containing protein